MATSMKSQHMFWMSWGANSYGQLCQSHNEDQLLPQLSQAPDGCTAVSGGGGHTFFIVGNGQALYGCGWNSKGQLGVGTTEDCSVPARVTLPDVKVQKVAAGWDFSFVLDDSGRLYGCGSNVFGQLGMPGVVKWTSTFTEVSLSEKVYDVSCGLRHTVIVTESGSVLCCGAGKKGQLGSSAANEKPPKESRCFTPVSLIPKHIGQVISVTAGAYHTAALTDTGSIIAWGENKHGQLAVDPNVLAQACQPMEITHSCFHNEKIVNLYSGWTHMMAITASGCLYTWGRGDYGQLGRPLPSRLDHAPQRLEGLLAPDGGPRQVVLGSEHSLLLDTSGRLFSWGWNEHGLCATGDEKNVLRPAPVGTLEGKMVHAIGCGMGHSFALVDNQKSKPP